jgi:hypothetical protein
MAQSAAGGPAERDGRIVAGERRAPAVGRLRTAPAVARRPPAPCALLVALALFAIGLAPHAAAAQNERPRHGLWIGFGLGGGQVEHRSDQEPATTKTTVTVSLRGGITVVPALRLGIEVNGWGLETSNPNDPARGVTVNEFMTIAQVYPWPAGHLYLKAGVGWASFNTNHADDWGSKAYGATVLGVGYDLRVARDVFVTLGADWGRGPLGDANPLITTSTGRRFRAWAVDVGIQYH